MAPQTPRGAASSNSASTTSSLKSSFKSPPPKQSSEENTPPVPGPPPPPLIIPGPNAFAKHLRDNGDDNPIASAADTYGIHGDVQRNIHTPPMLDFGARSSDSNDQKSWGQHGHVRGDSSTDRSQNARGSARTSSSWSGQVPSLVNIHSRSGQEVGGSRFLQYMRHARHQLDTQKEHEVQDVQLDVAHKLRLVPSPRPDIFGLPTNRAVSEERTQERLRQLIENNGAISPSTQIATIHEPAQSLVRSDGASSLTSSSAPRLHRSPKNTS